MQVTLEYTAQLRRAAGVRSEVIELPESASLMDALRAAADRHDKEFRQQLFSSNNEPQPTLLFFHGDVQVPAGCDPSLRDGDAVTVMSPISGG